MIVGIGTDIVEIGRVQALIERRPEALDRLFTDAEKALLDGKAKARRAEYLAGRFAAKEAAAKALGTGIGGQVGFHDVEVFSSDNGKPDMRISRAALERVGLNPERVRVHLSISHSRDYAVAQVVVEEL
ncbi:holo-ACP synthase [Brevibacillus sp. WF146]|uniref:holo-ACP synthase n=1 Tax=Brevibacillus sp. WF146 TaxID=319501 RepID=UPI0005D12E3B|nr:holo-ACP synthase [Brevibacillus sp. WF146]UYZ13267.1 holo-ACP synthase [Brevibacillus sp. WF146]